MAEARQRGRRRRRRRTTQGGYCSCCWRSSSSSTAASSTGSQQYKGIIKFKDGPLLHEEEKAIMYEDIRNTGDDHWAPSSGAAPQSLECEIGDKVDDNKDEDYDGNEESDECEEVSPASAKGKRPTPIGRKDKRKKPKSSGGHWVRDQLSKLVTMTERSTASCESLAKREDNFGCSIKDVMALVRSVVLFPEQRNTS